MFATTRINRSSLSKLRQVRFLSDQKPFTLPELDYGYGQLEPFISGEIMELHHSKHHQTYVNNFNNATSQLSDALKESDKVKITQLQSTLNFNGGGHINHSIFWKNLLPVSMGGGGEPGGELGVALKNRFGDFDTFKARFCAQTAAVQGSGWGWLVYNPSSKNIEIVCTSNQDPVSSIGLIPLLGVDVWEHAYYLQYKNVRPDYLSAIWNVVNWNDVESRYIAAQSSSK